MAATGVGGVDVEAGRLSPTAGASPPEARAQPAALDGTVAQPSYSGGGASAELRAHGPIVYPTSLLALVACTCAVAALWAIDFLLVVAPALEAHAELAASRHDDREWRGCYWYDQRARRACFMIVSCFLLFVTVRGLMQVRPIGRRLQAARRGRLGSWTMCLSIAVVHGPLLVFTVSSLVLNVMEQSGHEDCKDMQLIRTLKTFGCYSLLVAVMSCVTLLWNALLRAGALIEARRRNEKTHRGAPPGLLTQILTVPYDPDLFGTEDGRRYHGECSICLQEFEAEDEIKVPHCGHAFHENCLGRWLLKERTCALCRQDVTRASAAGAEGVGSGADVAAPGTSGLEEATPGAATAAPSGVLRVQPVALGRVSSAGGAAADSEMIPTHERSA